MHLIVIAGGEMQKEFQNKPVPEGVTIKFISSLTDSNEQAAAYFYLLPEENLAQDKNALALLSVPVFVNAVTTTLTELPPNCIRINAWTGFVAKATAEVCAYEQNQQLATQILEDLNWKPIWVPDIIGMIAPRTIAMIINEAYFALGDDVSGQDDMDTAMKLGTNYPHGPFEWAKIIGHKNIINLLDKLNITDNKYISAPLLVKEAQ